MPEIVMIRYGALRRQSGLTLIEMIVTIVLLAIALAGVAFAIGNSVTQSGQTLIELRAAALAQAYLDEILGKRYDENTRARGVPPCRASAPPARQCTAEANFGHDYSSPVETGESSRDRLDDVDDYDGMDEGDGQTLPLQDAEGNTRTGYDNFRVTVDVRYINLGSGEEEENLQQGTTELDDQYDAKFITVTVFYRGISEGFVFSAYKSNF